MAQIFEEKFQKIPEIFPKCVSVPSHKQGKEELNPWNENNPLYPATNTELSPSKVISVTGLGVLNTKEFVSPLLLLVLVLLLVWRRFHSRTVQSREPESTVLSTKG